MGAARLPADRLTPVQLVETSAPTRPPIVARAPVLRLVTAGDPGLTSVCIEPMFDPAERWAILIGRGDNGSSFDRASRLGRLIWILFGIRGPNPLADPKLEALRQVAAALRRGTRRIDLAVEAAIAAGVAPAKIDHLLSR